MKSGSVGLALLAALVLSGCDHSERASYERGVAALLKTIISAQQDFRANDRDGNGLEDFWRKDIAGLYSLRGKDGKPLALIHPSTALADDRPQPGRELGPTSVPWCTYRFRVLRFADEKTPDPQRWAACAVPGREGDCRYVFIVSHVGLIFRKPIEKVRHLELFPADPLKDGWEKVD